MGPVTSAIKQPGSFSESSLQRVANVLSTFYSDFPCTKSRCQDHHSGNLNVMVANVLQVAEWGPMVMGVW